ncbi:MAG TPA: precorrin-3B C(17)-methyltransferase [Candidatus Merdivicinus intestinavium]|nr:precorrin-3B C(17)-methyltransferase [Candidatus Merdivicinus intestinavium]
MQKLYVVGLGPGGREYMTGEARAALEEAELLCGYTVYIDLIRADYPDKEVLATPMTQEIERCRMAVEAAESGKTVAMVCSGDAGVYGMAGLIYETAGENSPVEIVVVPGITAALSGAAVLGAPLIHDFAVISLSDLLTPWETIEKRLRAAGEADFCICLYNPSSKKRADYLKRACGILLESRDPQNACGWVKNIGREGQESRVMTLSELMEEKVDMFTTVFIGNSSTRVMGGKLVTPRGYENKRK